MIQNKTKSAQNSGNIDKAKEGNDKVDIKADN